MKKNENTRQMLTNALAIDFARARRDGAEIPTLAAAPSLVRSMGVTEYVRELILEARKIADSI